jgi:hypothetical protein
MVSMERPKLYGRAKQAAPADTREDIAVRVQRNRRDDDPGHGSMEMDVARAHGRRFPAKR